MKLADVDEAIRAAKAEIARQKAILLTLQRLRLQFADDRTYTVPNMQPETNSARRSRPGRPRTIDHEFPRALEANGMTVTAWAKKHRLEREVVKAWFAAGSGGRRIPRDWADRIEKELGVPATETVWKNGIR